MKQYPRIYSLSTIGLIHHQQFDYKFHPLRTDFVGESGSGKSMIADLLQLIFVGGSAFESATKGIDDRNPEGMVLTSPGRGTDVGYAFLNIELAERKFVVVGVYIETASRHTQSFIIQRGYEAKELWPFDNPISYEDLLDKEAILPIDLLIEVLERKNLVCTSWQRIKPFHQVLYENGILPLDLASNEQVLFDYAQIMQSFSRGKSLETKKSSSLKNFFFGKEKANEIHKLFKQTEKELASVVGEYGRNLDEISRVTAKYKQLADLKEKKSERDEKLHKWLSTDVSYRVQEEEACEGIIKTLQEQYNSSVTKVLALREHLQKELDLAKILNHQLQKEEQEAKERFERIIPDHSRLREFSSWLTAYKCDAEELREVYRKNVELKELKQALDSFIETLNKAKLCRFYESLNWNGSFQELQVFLKAEIEALEPEIAQKKILKQYSDLTNEDSLGNWALKQNRSFSPEEESAILHFQSLSRHKPDLNPEPAITRYLPKPEDLFKSLKVAEIENKGYWVDLCGLREFIPLAEYRILASNDEATIASYFNAYSEALEEEIAERSMRLENLKSLLVTVQGLENPTLCVKAFSLKSMLDANTDFTLASVGRHVFDTNFDCFRNKDFIKEEYSTARAKSESTSYSFITNVKFIEELGEILNETVEVLSTEFEEIEQPAVTDNMLGEAFHGSTVVEKKLKVYRNVLYDNKVGTRLRASILDKQNELKALGEEKRKAVDRFQSIYKISFDFSLCERCSFVYLKQAESDYLAAEKIYQLSFSNVLSSYLPNDQYRFVDNYDFVELGKNLLPEAFHGVKITEDSVIEKIERYLRNINEKNRALNSRKMLKVYDLVDEIDDAISFQLNIIRRVKNFFKAEKAQITGGYYVKLKESFATSYSRGWIVKFKEGFKSNVGLFSDMDGLSERLAQKVSLEEIILEAFQIYGGAKNISPGLSSVLDPCSYYDLSFSMESLDGRKNKGSTGQTYAAIALLCIARLSVISSKESKENEAGLRIMPVDEAEGLGSNFDMLYQIAKSFDYQIVSMSVNPVGRFEDGEQYIYMLHKNMEVAAPVNYTPFAILCQNDVDDISS